MAAQRELEDIPEPNEVEKILGGGLTSLEDHLRKEGNLVAGCEGFEEAKTFYQKYCGSRKLGNCLMKWAFMQFPATLYHASFVIVITDIIIRTWLPFYYVLHHFEPFGCNAASFNNASQTPYKVKHYAVQEAPVEAKDVFDTTWALGSCMGFESKFYDLSIPDDPVQDEQLCTKFYMRPEHGLYFVGVVIVILVFLALVQYLLQSSVRPTAFRAQQYSIAILAGLKGCARLVGQIGSTIILVASMLSYNSDDVLANDNKTELYRWVMAASASLYHDVVLNGMMDSGQKANPLFIAVKAVVIYVFIYEILPSLQLLRSFELRAIHSPSLGAVVTYVSHAIVIFSLPFTRCILGALDFVHQQTLASAFYNDQQAKGHDGWDVVEMNDPEWPVPPIYICNCVQHDVTDSQSLIAVKTPRYRPAGDPKLSTTYNHFEITSHHWGNAVVGYWRPPTNMRLSSAMSISSATALQSSGRDQSQRGWAGCISFLMTTLANVFGIEMGRTLPLRQHGKHRPHECKSKNRFFDISLERLSEVAMVILLLSLSIVQMVQLDNEIHDSWSGAPLAYVNQYGVCHQSECYESATAHDKGSYSAVVTYMTNHSAVKPWRTMEFTQYLSRFGVNTNNVCQDQTQFETCDASRSTLRSLSNLAWVSEAKHHFVWPLNPTQDSQCVERSWSEHYQWLLTSSQSPCSTECCASALLAQSRVVAYYMCGFGNTMTNLLFYIQVFLILLIFLAPALSAFRPFWLLGHSHISLLLFQLIGFQQYIADPFTSPPAEIFLTDGSHIDSSGAYALLKRKCKCIVTMDSNPVRDCASFYALMELSRRKLDCSWLIDPKETAAVDPVDYMLDFRLPRARFIGHGEAAVADKDMLLDREMAARRLMLGEMHDETTTRWCKASIRQLTSHVRSQDGHVYLYFMDDKSLCQAFRDYHFIRQNFRICQSLTDMADLEPVSDDFLDSDVMEQETLRHSAHFWVRFNDGSRGDFFFLHGELSPNQKDAVRGQLKGHEFCQLPWTTIGSFPYHHPWTQGYTWAHMNAYAEFGKTTMEYVWHKHGLKDKILGSKDPLAIDRDDDAIVKQIVQV